MTVYWTTAVCVAIATLLAAHVSAVLDGSDATPHEFPSIVSVKVQNTHLCGGTIIGPRHILTAAHDVYRFQDFDAETLYQWEIFVFLEEHDLSTETAVRVSITAINVHWSYVYQGHYEQGDDLAILTLDRDIPQTEKVKYAKLPALDAPLPPEGTLCWVVGWGSTTESARHNHNILQKGQLKVIGTAECQRIMTIPNIKIDGKKQVCTAPGPKTVSGCGSDAGGPLFCTLDNVVTQIGVMSFGQAPCTRQNRPTVFSKIANYRVFIDTFNRWPGL